MAKNNEFITISLSKLEPNEGQLEGLPSNPRQITEAKMALLKQNIKQYPEMLNLRGLMVYPLDNGKYIIIGGNMRYRAMSELGMKDAPCVVIPKETDIETLKAYTIIDNNGFGKYDWDMLANEWDEYQLEEWGVDLPVFEDEEVNEEDFGEDFSLPNEGKSKYGVITFQVTEEQRDFINFVVDVGKYCDGFKEDCDNENQNGASLFLICSEFYKNISKFENKSVEQITKDFEDLKKYLRNALKKSGLKAADIDKHLGTNGMSGHYFGESQWMFPTPDAYKKLQEIMPLDREYIDCKKIELEYNKAKKITDYGQMH
ncbi:MAG TPA: hypothetical protein DCG33_01675 [Prevotellaceae bacterium]|nr:hypothetical protein [Prevotellaceae bacterium]